MIEDDEKAASQTVFADLYDSTLGSVYGFPELNYVRHRRIYIDLQ